MIEQPLEALAPSPEQPVRPPNAAHRGFDVEHPTPLVGAETIAAIWGVSVSQIYRRIRNGEFDAFKTKPPIGPKCFSGILLAQYLKGEPLFESRFFGKSKRRA